MEIFDIAIIGAGAVGCAAARRLALAGRRVLVLEKGSDILSGASKANSAILHTGFDAPEGSLELECIQAGYREYMAIRTDFNLPVLETGAMVLAWNDGELARLPQLAEVARRNGVTDVRLLDGSEVCRREPHLDRQAQGGLWVPGEHVIDPWSPFLGYARQAIANGAVFSFEDEVLTGDFDGVAWTMETSKTRWTARHIVNCAGLGGDHIERRLLGDASFEIRPRKGQFAVYDKIASRLLNAIILPVPSETTKGVVLCRTAFGNVIIGPTAEEQEDRDRPTVERKELERLLARAEAMLPALRSVPVTAVYAGLRPATEKKEYRIRHEPDRNWLTVGGIRSTGMTSSLGLAQLVARLVIGEVTDLPDVSQAPFMPNLAEHLPRDWSNSGYGEILCHCEMVTDREVKAALATAPQPRDLAGLKRRTRCAMGGCQGFNCLGRLAQIAGDTVQGLGDAL